MSIAAAILSPWMGHLIMNGDFKAVNREPLAVSIGKRGSADSFIVSRLAAYGLRLTNKGFTYIAVMMLVVVMGIALSMAGRYWSTVAKRDREEELLFRGDQIRKGIEAYYKWTAQKHGGTGIYPESLEELLKSKFSAAPKRFLRRIYKDPVTGKADWVIITDPSKRVIGVRSASDEEPLKTSNFPLVYRNFEGKTKYSDWVFAHGPASQPAQPKK